MYMRSRSIVKTMKTACGKIVSYLQTEGHPNKMHSIEGPAIIYPESDNKAPEYYFHGIKYSKLEWKELTSQRKAHITVDASPIDSEDQTIY